MPSTHQCLQFHLIFSTKDRRPLMVTAWRDRLHAYLGGITHDLGGVALAVGGTEDHVHLLVGLRATHRLADFMRELKHASSQWMHQTVGSRGFAWQEGYGAFSISSSDVEAVRRYIATQDEHHQTRTFQEEYVAFLRENGVEYDERYLW